MMRFYYTMAIPLTCSMTNAIGKALEN